MRLGRDAAGPVPAPRIALLHWGDLIEDFLDTIGLSFETFRDELTGGWMFGYVEALERAGVEVVLVCVTARSTVPEAHVHGPTGARIWLLPASRLYRLVRERSRSGSPAARALGEVTPYLATPVVQLARVLRREGCRALLCQEYETPRFDACVALGRALGVPVFATFQGGDTQLFRLERLVRPHTLGAASGLVVASERERRRVVDRYRVPEGKLARIPNPFAADGWGVLPQAEARQRLELPARAEIAIWHGRVDVHLKGLDTLLEAWRRLGREGRLLVLVGSGPDDRALRVLIERARLQSVHRVEEYVLDRARLATLLAAADLYVFPSRREGFPVAPLEAMASSLPIVATDVSGVTEIVGTGDAAAGVVVPSGDASALAAAVDRLFEEPDLRRRLAIRGRARVTEEFAPEVVGARLRRLLLGRPAEAERASFILRR